MGSKNAPIVTQWLPFPWEKEHDEEISDEELNELRKQIEAENQARAAEQK